jgi:hypothetical protein
VVASGPKAVWCDDMARQRLACCSVGQVLAGPGKTWVGSHGFMRWWDLGNIMGQLRDRAFALLQHGRVGRQDHHCPMKSKSMRRKKSKDKNKT